MKKIILTILSLVTLAISGFPREWIYLKNGEMIEVKIVESSDLFIKFHFLEGEDQKTIFELKKSQILVILSDNMEKDSNVESIYNIGGDTSQMCIKGRTDAQKYYNGGGPLWGTLCCTGGTNPIFGVIFAAVSSSTKPKVKNLRVPFSEIASDSTYLACYEKEAHKIKKKNVWGGFGVGTALYGIFLAVFLSQ